MVDPLKIMMDEMAPGAPTSAPFQVPSSAAALVCPCDSSSAAMVTSPAVSNMATLVMMAVFILVQVISFNVSLMRVMVEMEAVAPLDNATAEIVFASPAGAACTELAETAP